MGPRFRGWRIGRCKEFPGNFSNFLLQLLYILNRCYRVSRGKRLRRFNPWINCRRNIIFRELCKIKINSEKEKKLNKKQLNFLNSFHLKG